MISDAERYYGGVVWTDHALQRLKERGVSQATALATLKRPQRSRYAAQKQAWIYNRSFGSVAVEVVATKNDRAQWVVMSVWSREAGSLKPSKYLVRNQFVDLLFEAVGQLFKRFRGKA